jgi:nitrous oxidase accessory protein NosD
MSSIFVWDGTLHAVGTPENYITFTSSAVTPAPADWHSIHIGNAQGHMIVQYAVIEYGYYGIQLDATTDNEHVTLSNNIIRRIVACGICCGMSNVSITISANDISECGHEGIDTHVNSNVIIDGNILHNSPSGVVAFDNMPVIHNNQFLNNNIAINTSSASMLSSVSGNYYYGNDQNCYSTVEGPIPCPDE